MRKVISILSMLFLISCGGGSSGNNIPATDNSTLTDLENEYGYYGNLVEVGGEKITNIWLVYTMEWEELGDFYFYDNGTYKFSDTSGNYGISKDGKSIYTDDYATFTLISVENGTYSITNNGIEEQRNCLIMYDGDENARLCPFK